MVDRSIKYLYHSIFLFLFLKAEVRGHINEVQNMTVDVIIDHVDAF